MSKKASPFDAAQFTATKWATAEDKAKWASAMASWVTRGFPANGWKKNLYHHLHGMYGHIAEYNQFGFYEVWFADIHKQLQWLQYITDKGVFWHGVGDPQWTWSDVETAFSAWVRETGLLKRYQQLCSEDIEAKERALLAHLQHKYSSVQTDQISTDLIPVATTVPTSATTQEAAQKLPSSPVQKRQREKKVSPPKYAQYSLFEEEPDNETNERKDAHHHEPLSIS